MPRGRGTSAASRARKSNGRDIDVVDGGTFAGVKVLGTSAANVLDFTNVTLTNVSLIDGGSNSDTIIGSTDADADAIYGNAGVDLLTGGLGEDTFVYRLVSESGVGLASDRIADFVSGVDHLDLSGIDAIAGGANNAFTFIGSNAFVNAGDLRVDYGTSGVTLIQGDANGDHVADMQIVLLGKPSVLATDIVV